MPEAGWLIEKRERFPAEYLAVIAGMFDWVHDSTLALRFSRETDAERMAEIFLAENVVVNEHLWS
jgi:hypothetical protein